MKTAATLLLFAILIFSCTPKPINKVIKTTPNLEDGFYVVTKTGNSKQQLQPLSNTQQIITYNKEFLDPEDDRFLVIEADDFVPMNLKEKPITQQTDNNASNFYITLNDEAKSKLEQFTTLNLYKITAIVVGGEAYTKHQIKAVIDGGKLQITQCSENSCRILYDQFDDNVVGLPSNLDWANLQRFAKANEKLGAPKEGENRVVFMGNSITQGWSEKGLTFFEDNNYINRGIGGQTTPQMLIRFRPDVIELQPKVVVILAGINDIAGNTGPMSLKTTAGNIISMAELAKANGIEPVICTVLPALDFPWKPGMNPSEKVVRLNQLLTGYCALTNTVCVDYFTPMANDQNAMKKGLSYDIVHTTAEGYKVMEGIVQEGIQEALKRAFQ